MHRLTTLLERPLLVVRLGRRHEGAGVESLELAQRHAVAEHELDLLEGPALALGHAEEDEEEADEAHAAKDEADLGVEAAVLGVDDVGDREADDEAVMSACFVSMTERRKKILLQRKEESVYQDVLGCDLGDEAYPDGMVAESRCGNLGGHNVDKSG